MSAPRTPRPVADAPVAGLEDGGAIAKAWLVALVDRAELDEAADLPVGTVAASGPGLAAALVAALGSDGALDGLGPAAVPLRSFGDGAAVVAATEALRAAAWGSLRSRLVDPDPALIGDLADRLAHVCSLLTAHALAGHATTPAVAEAAPSLAQALESVLRARTGALIALEGEAAGRLLEADDDGATAAALAGAWEAVRATLAADDRLLRAEPARWWIVTQSAQPHELARRAVAVAGATAGAPAFCAGVAEIPGDGDTEAELGACADERLFAARAAGVPLI